MMKPSPPKKPPFGPLNAIDISTPASLARKERFWRIMSLPGVMSNALMEPGKLDANAIMPLPPWQV